MSIARQSSNKYLLQYDRTHNRGLINYGDAANRRVRGTLYGLSRMIGYYAPPFQASGKRSYKKLYHSRKPVVQWWIKKGILLNHIRILPA